MRPAAASSAAWLEYSRAHREREEDRGEKEKDNSSSSTFIERDRQCSSLSSSMPCVCSRTYASACIKHVHTHIHEIEATYMRAFAHTLSLSITLLFTSLLAMNILPSISFSFRLSTSFGSSPLFSVFPAFCLCCSCREHTSEKFCFFPLSFFFSFCCTDPFVSAFPHFFTSCLPSCVSSSVSVVCTGVLIFCSSCLFTSLCSRF